MAQHRKQGKDSSAMEGCWCNCYFVFLLGFFIGICMVVAIRSSNNKGEAKPKISIDTLFVQKQVSRNLGVAKQLKLKAKNVQGSELARRMRILCWVMTAKHTHKTKALTVKRTWGRHCDKLLFFSETEDPEVPTIKIDKVQPGRSGLWTKVVGAYKYVQKHHRDEYDWVLRADDDSYAIIEGIREMLLPYNPEKPGFFGYRFLPFAPAGFFSGGGGIVLSKAALDRVVTMAFDGKHKDCPTVAFSDSADDVKIAQCLYAVGIVPDDTRDFRGRTRMHCYDVDLNVKPDAVETMNPWYRQNQWWPVKGGLDCCAENGFTWHYVIPLRMYMIQYLAYSVQVENVVFFSKAAQSGISITSATHQ
ncbi:glycoprotein-N-acetylgalactosamine 3-beta-galactosyltransferase 1-like [Neocloeon triangulifer]|uniref:glycoprotein-N-acetylgalactosamine 3-beta-galactosyltransferase 1-like n=1 Tax=Neocloeon triangulifer TaxID=2078957 RepID=UPI00286ECDAD|nr:glycoprotein-N-acetylgalactosamine 3-beta-galactosyltransferase 1-like [Neocloeon triangulifer]